MNDTDTKGIGGAIKGLCLYISSVHKYLPLKLMSKKKKSKKTNSIIDQKVFEQQQPEKNNSLIFGGILLAMSSIGLLIFVLSDKVFHLN